MKNSFYILIILLIFSCKKEKEYIFTEDEAYKLVNEYFIKEISKRDTFLLFNSRQLMQPDYENTTAFEFEEEMKQIIIKEPSNYGFSPRLTKEEWKSERLNKVKIIKSKEWFSFFKKNDTIDLKQIWNNKYGFNEAHNVSYPIYNPKTKIAIVKDYEFKPFWRGCTIEDNTYVYRRVDTTWVLLAK